MDKNKEPDARSATKPRITPCSFSLLTAHAPSPETLSTVPTITQSPRLAFSTTSGPACAAVSAAQPAISSKQAAIPCSIRFIGFYLPVHGSKRLPQEQMGNLVKAAHPPASGGETVGHVT